LRERGRPLLGLDAELTAVNWIVPLLKEFVAELLAVAVATASARSTIWGANVRPPKSSAKKNALFIIFLGIFFVGFD
jgi:hypothetical protein